jgi:hypothetical protein
MENNFFLFTFNQMKNYFVFLELKNKKTKLFFLLHKIFNTKKRELIISHDNNEPK